MVVRQITTNLYRIGEAEFNAARLLSMLRRNAQEGQVHQVAPQTLSVQGALYLPPQVLLGMEQDLGAPVHRLVWGIRYH